MPEKCYSIVMQTPLGKRHGTLTTVISDDALSGWLNILGHTQPFEGTLDSSGNCTIKGAFTTLMRTVPFVASGTLTASRVCLQVKEARNVFQLTGVPCLEGGKTKT